MKYDLSEEASEQSVNEVNEDTDVEIQIDTSLKPEPLRDLLIGYKNVNNNCYAGAAFVFIQAIYVQLTGKLAVTGSLTG